MGDELEERIENGAQIAGGIALGLLSLKRLKEKMDAGEI